MKKRALAIIVVFFVFCFFVDLALAFKVGQTGVVNGLPYTIYNSTYGLYYGVIGKGENLLGREESLTLSAWLITNGGKGTSFIFSLPDSSSRHGKMYPLAFDLNGMIAKTIFERYYGLGSESIKTGYTTFDNEHNKLSFQFSRPISRKLLGEVDLFYATNSYSNIVQGNSPLTQAIQDVAREYAGASVKLTVDGRDQVVNPHNGIYMIGNFDFSLRNCNYVKGGIDLRSYSTPFNSDQIFASRLMLQQAAGDSVPIYELPFLGGNDTMRGYTMNRWRDRASALVNLEYRFPLFQKWIQIVTFLEAGKVGSMLSDIGLNNWVSDYGLGLHLNLGGSIIVRGDLGYGKEGSNMYFFYNQAF
ncbi:MAG: BamA/TamA family outer membrane protein [Candidatus Saganbacteria bacterium]|nr:BamA/TamA family outer membrane protein [Candidatus Saganbacteria bacterium]